MDNFLECKHVWASTHTCLVSFLTLSACVQYNHHRLTSVKWPPCPVVRSLALIHSGIEHWPVCLEMGLHASASGCPRYLHLLFLLLFFILSHPDWVNWKHAAGWSGTEGIHLGDVTEPVSAMLEPLGRSCCGGCKQLITRSILLSFPQIDVELELCSGGKFHFPTMQHGSVWV